MWKNHDSRHLRTLKKYRKHLLLHFLHVLERPSCFIAVYNTPLRLLYLLSDFSNGFLFIVWWLISAHGPSRFLFYANVINSCSVFHFPLSQILLCCSLQTLVIVRHRCWKMMEVLNKIFFDFYSSLFIVFPNSGPFSVFRSLIGGDNLPQAVQETTPLNFECLCHKSFLRRWSLVG